MKNIDLKKVTFNELQKIFGEALEDIMIEFGNRIIDDIAVHNITTASFINDFEASCKEECLNNKHQFEVVEGNKNPLNGCNRISVDSVESNNTLLKRVSQSEEVLKMREVECEAILHIHNTSDLFSRLYSNHGDYFLQEYEPYQWVMSELFASMSDQGLKEALDLPNNIFKGLIQKELDEREESMLIMSEKPSRPKEFNVVNPVTKEAEGSALSNPAFREILSLNPMFEEIKEESGIDLLDYDSLNDFFFAYYSTLETKVLMNYASTSDGEGNETIKAVLASRKSMESSVLQYELGERDE